MRFLFFALLIVIAITIVAYLSPNDPFHLREIQHSGAPAASIAFSVPLPAKDIRVGNTPLRVELAEQPQEWQEGLSHRTQLSDNSGMLFVFPTAGPRVFWMKEMLIPLDLLWIRNNIVVGITPDVPIEPGISDTQLRQYHPPEDVDTVLEVNAGWARAHTIQVGDRISDNIL